MRRLSYLSTPNPNPFQYKSLIDVLTEKATTLPDKEILIERSRGGNRKSLTYKQLQMKSEKLAYYLVANGIGVGDSVGIIGPNSLEWIIGEFSIFMTGAVAVHIQNTSETFSETLKLLNFSQCKAALIDADDDVKYLSEMKKNINSTKHSEFNEENPMVIFIKKPRMPCKLPSIEAILSEDCETRNANNSLPRVSPESPALIFMTSGSTGVPKLAVYTHFSLGNATFASFVSSGADEIGKLYSDRPFTWLGGTPIFNIMVGNPRVFADTRLSLEKKNILEIWDMIVSEKCLNAHFLPYSLSYLIEHKVDITKQGYKLYGILTGGQVIESRFTEVIGIFCEKLFCVYASTEMGVVTSTDLNSDMEVGNVGRLYSGYEVKIVDDKEETLDRGKIGEILVRSPFTMRCYRNVPNLNKRSFSNGGWFRSGDLGVIAVDDMLRVKGKAKDVIKRGGMKILSSVVESIIAEINGVEEVVVIAVPDVYLLEEVCACVVLERGTSIRITDIKSICNEKLGDNTLGNSPSFYLIFEDFPRLSNGKVDKIQIKQQVMDKLKF